MRVQKIIDFHCVNKRKQDKTNKKMKGNERKRNNIKQKQLHKTKQNKTHKTRQNTEECKNKTLNKQIANNKKCTSLNEVFQKAVSKHCDVFCARSLGGGRKSPLTASLTLAVKFVSLFFNNN